MMTDQNREIIRRLYQEASSQRSGAGNFKARRNLFTQYTVTSRPSSLKAFKNFFSAISAAFSEYELTIENIAAKGDRVMVRYTITGTQTGDLMGVTPTNEGTTVTGIDVFRLDNGRIAEHWDAAHQICTNQAIRKPLAGSRLYPKEKTTVPSPDSQYLSLSR